MSDKARKGAYLPPLPEGWEYTVTIKSGGDKITVDGTSVGIVAGEHKRTSTVSSLADGIREGVAAAKELTSLAKIEAKAAEARNKVLSKFSTDSRPPKVEAKPEQKPAPVNPEAGKDTGVKPDPALAPAGAPAK